MFVIVCGMDRCGKTTLIGNLRKHYFTNPKLIVHHSSSPPKVENPNEWELEHYDELFRQFLELSTYQGYDIVCDRFHLGMFVYGGKYRNMDLKLVWSLDEYWCEIIPLQDCLSKSQFPTVIVLTDYAEKIDERDDGLGLEVDLDDIENTRQAFTTAFMKTKAMNKLHINITENGGFENTLPTVTRFLDTVKG